MNKGYSLSQWRLSNTYNEEDQTNILRQFIATFEDSHMGVSYAAKQTNKKTISSKKLEILALTSDIHWISIPSFKLGEQEIVSIKQIIDQLPSLQNDKAIIFDLRGNHGGDSAWSIEILEALFEKEYADYYLQEWNKNTYVEYRVSQDNILHWQHCIDRLARQFGENSYYTQHLSKILHGMQEAQKKGFHYYRDEANPSTPTTLQPITTFHSNIYVIIDNGCGSACLDFIDGLMAMQQPIIMIGEPTGADSNYMDCRSIELPSNQGKLTIPTKVYHNRPRGNNEPYFPNIIYPNDLSDTETVKSFVLAEIKNRQYLAEKREN